MLQLISNVESKPWFEQLSVSFMLFTFIWLKTHTKSNKEMSVVKLAGFPYHLLNVGQWPVFHYHNQRKFHFF